MKAGWTKKKICFGVDVQKKRMTLVFSLVFVIVIVEMPLYVS